MLMRFLASLPFTMNFVMTAGMQKKNYPDLARRPNASAGGWGEAGN